MCLQHYLLVLPCKIGERPQKKIYGPRFDFLNVWGAANSSRVTLVDAFKYRGSLSSCPRVSQLSRDVPADVHFLCDKAAILWDTIKETCRMWHKNFSENVMFILCDLCTNVTNSNTNGRSYVVFFVSSREDLKTNKAKVCTIQRSLRFWYATGIFETASLKKKITLQGFVNHWSIHTVKYKLHCFPTLQLLSK